MKTICSHSLRIASKFPKFLDVHSNLLSSKDTKARSANSETSPEDHTLDFGSSLDGVLLLVLSGCSRKHGYWRRKSSTKANTRTNLQANRTQPHHPILEKTIKPNNLLHSDDLLAFRSSKIHSRYLHAG